MGTVPPGRSRRTRDADRAREPSPKAFTEVTGDHPRAAHNVLHAYDDPINAGKALDAAERYVAAEIAPDTPHALHMPSHIFLQLGRWPDAAESNVAAWAASNQWVEKRKLATGNRDYHSLHWLQYIYLQQGRYRDARELLSEMERSVRPRLIRRTCAA